MKHMQHIKQLLLSAILLTSITSSCAAHEPAQASAQQSDNQNDYPHITKSHPFSLTDGRKVIFITTEELVSTPDGKQEIRGSYSYEFIE